MSIYQLIIAQLVYLSLFLIGLPQIVFGQQPCGKGGLKVKMDSNAAYAALDEQEKVVIPYEKRPLVVLSQSLVKVSSTYTNEKWGVLDRQNHQLLPLEYDYLEVAGCDYLQGRKGDESFLFNSKGQVVYHETGKFSFAAYPRFNRFVIAHIEPGPNQRTDAIRILDLHTLKQVFAQNPGSGAELLTIDWNTTPPGEKRRGGGILPFYKVWTSAPGSGGSKQLTRIIDLQGKVLFDNIDRWVSVDAGGVVYLHSDYKPVIITDTLMRPIPWLNGYDEVRRNGPRSRYWQVSRDGKSGLLDGKGRVVLPLQYAGQFSYVGANSYILSEYRGKTMFRSLITADRKLIDLADYYIEDGIDTTLARKPILLKHQKTYKTGIFDPQRGFILPVRYDLLARTDKGLIFFQKDSAGYMDSRGRVQMLTPGCQVLSAYSEGYAVCGKLVPNASRERFPSAQIIYSAEGSAAVQYAYMNASGKLISGYFDWVGPFRGGYAQVIKNNETFMVDTKGQKVAFRPGEILVSYFEQGVAIVQQGQHFGLVDKTGRLLLPVQFNSIETDRNQPGGPLISKVNKGNHMLAVAVPKFVKGTIEVVADDGKKSRVTVEGIK